MRMSQPAPQPPVVGLVDPADNPFLQDQFSPVGEEVDVDDVRVEGRLPEDLNGRYLRNGPNPQFAPIGSYTYPFDGDGMVHMLTFDHGKVGYRNRWVTTRGLRAERRAGRALYGGMLTPFMPDTASLGPDDDPSPFKNVANTNVVHHAGRTLALGDGSMPYEIGSDLSTIGEYDFDGTLPGGMTAHPKIDPVWDELFFFRSDVVPPYLVYGVVGPKGRVTRMEPVETPEPTLIHDFVVTEQHVVFFDCPAVFDFEAMLRGEQALHWREGRGTRIGVMPREGTADETLWIPVEDCFVMHFLNGYSEDDKIVVDYVHRSRPDIFGGGHDNAPRLHRSVIDLSRRSVHDEVVDYRAIEFPRVDDRRTGLPHRFGYAAAASDPSGVELGFFDSVVRYDFESGTSSEHRFQPGVIPGEPLFVPRPDGPGEHDGWVLVMTYDIDRHKSDLVVLDAARFASVPVAVVHLPVRVPMGLHGNWFPAG
ncbi:MAG: carotenoid oxygenase family protein [Actinobacteria bacterium]|nr:carotenoid oxygenase family protein [Actinomycetota bacterium]